MSPARILTIWNNLEVRQSRLLTFAFLVLERQRDAARQPLPTFAMPAAMFPGPGSPASAIWFNFDALWQIQVRFRSVYLPHTLWRPYPTDWYAATTQ